MLTRARICPECGEINRAWREHCSACQAILTDEPVTHMDIPAAGETKEGEEGTETRSTTGMTLTDIKDKIRIGMSYEELVELLGEPTYVTDSSELFGRSERVKVVGSRSSLGRLAGTLWCGWKRDEAEYMVTVVDGKLASIYSITPR